MNDDECRACGKTLSLNDGCEWPEEGPICWACLNEQLAAANARADNAELVAALGVAHYGAINSVLKARHIQTPFPDTPEEGFAYLYTRAAHALPPTSPAIERVRQIGAMVAKLRRTKEGGN